MTHFSLATWNVNGIRAVQKKGFWESLDTLGVDVISVQETKTDGEKMIPVVADIAKKGWSTAFLSATMRKGYSGVATLWRGGIEHEVDTELFAEKTSDTLSPMPSPLGLVWSRMGLVDEEFDCEGRIVLTKFAVEGSTMSFVLINGYYPQGGRGEHRIQYKLRFYQKVRELAQKLMEEGEQVILCGDFNTTVSDIDLARPKENKNTTGCLPIEREALGWFFELGLVDAFRHFYPDKLGEYSYWDQITRARERNVGWRIDTFFVSPGLLPHIKDCVIRPDIFGSDHCPVLISFEV
jgi:exodeoxyribonuclease III